MRGSAAVHGVASCSHSIARVTPGRALNHALLPEVAGTAVFLASNLGRGVTGNVIYVDAGFQVMGLPSN